MVANGSVLMNSAAKQIQSTNVDLPCKESLIGAVVFTLKENQISSLKNNILIAKSKIGEKIVARSNFELLNN